jgi:hypothetical protein
MFRRAIDEEKKTMIESSNHDFYFAVLDRIDILITEKGSAVGKPEVLEILR